MSAQPNQNHTPALGVLTSLFFMMGFITCLNDILIPHLKEVFTLTYVQAMLIQFCFFSAYAIMSIPASKVLLKLGYKNGVIGGFLIAAVGCLLFYPAAAAKEYSLFLGALFILATGITLLQVSGNPYVTLLSKPGKESSTLTLVQAFNSLGTTVAPILGGAFILAAVVKTPEEQALMDTATLAAYKTEQAASVQMPYLGLAAVLIILAIVVAFLKLPKAEQVEQDVEHNLNDGRTSVWQYKHLVLGALGIFCYVGAEVGIGSLLVNVMEETAGLDHKTAAGYLAMYWGGAMVGRFIGSAAMSKIKPNLYLAFNAGMNVLLIALAILIGGKVAMWGLIAIGFFNSIMFPTIFSLSVEKLGRFTSVASGVICTAIVGGAILPVVQGFFADNLGLMISFIVPLVCYLYIVYFGLKGHQPR